MLFMGESTISMAIFNSKLLNYQRVRGLYYTINFHGRCVFNYPIFIHYIYQLYPVYIQLYSLPIFIRDDHNPWKGNPELNQLV